MVEPNTTTMSIDADSVGTQSLQALPPANEEEDILKYLLSDTSASDFSSPDGSPLLVLEDSNSDTASPPHWVPDELNAPSELPDITLALGNTPELLLYGDNFNMDYNTIPMAPVPTALSQVVPAVVPVASSVTTASQPIIAPKKVNRSKKRPRASTPPPIPSPEQNAVALPRDTLLQISSQSMERYVENLSSTRALSMDDQKELKRQKRLIKNRESAQLSRERKRAYIDQLEDRIAQLVSENTSLKTENTSLKQALSCYTGETTTAITPSVMDVSADLIHRKPDPLAQHMTKMGGLLTSATTIGGARTTSTTAKAGVCLLIVLFTFGLFMNNTSNGSRGSLLLRRDATPDVVPYHERSLMPNLQVGYRRSILEAPEVLDEDNDDYVEASTSDQLIIPANTKSVERRLLQPVHVKPAGIYKLSYSAEPAKFLTPEPRVHGKQFYQKQDDNSTYMLFLDPRPDLDNDGMPDTPPTPTSTSTTGPTTSDLQVSTHTHSKTNVYPQQNLPPMIISLVVPEHISNGSNPLFPKEGYFSADSLMEITCQVMDVSITTSERPPKH